jgi:hypothetical protein
VVQILSGDFLVGQSHNENMELRVSL